MAQENPRRWSDEDLLLLIVALLCLSAGLLLIGDESGETVPHGPVAPPQQQYQTPRPREEYRAPRRWEEPAPRQEAPAPAPQRTTPAPGVWEDIRSRNVLVRQGAGQGSGVLIGHGLVLTDFHVVDGGWGAVIDGHGTAIVQAWDEGNDLAILKLVGYDPTPRLDFAFDPDLLRPGTRLVTVGNPRGVTVSQTGWVEAGSGQGFWARMDTWSGPGASGSLVYSLDGAPVGIVQQWDGTGIRVKCRDLRPIVRLLNYIGR